MLYVFLGKKNESERRKKKKKEEKKKKSERSFGGLVDQKGQKTSTWNSRYATSRKLHATFSLDQELSGGIMPGAYRETWNEW